MRALFLIVFLSLGYVVNAQSVLSQVGEKIAQKKYPEAESHLLKAIKNSSNAELLDKLGEIYGYQAEWDKAIEIYDELTAMYPEKADYYFRRGGVLAKKAQTGSKFTALTLLGKIKRNFKKAIELDSVHIRAHWALVDLYVSLPVLVGGSYDKAEEYAQQLFKLSELDGYLALGYIYEYDDKPIKAKEMYLKALSLFETSEGIDRNQLHYQIGKVCGDYDEKLDLGITHMHQYIEAYTVLDGVPLEWAYYRMARLYRKKGEKSKALNWINESLALRAQFGPALEEKKKILQL